MEVLETLIVNAHSFLVLIAAEQKLFATEIPKFPCLQKAMGDGGTLGCGSIQEGPNFYAHRIQKQGRQKGGMGSSRSFLWPEKGITLCRPAPATPAPMASRQSFPVRAVPTGDSALCLPAPVPSGQCYPALRPWSPGSPPDRNPKHACYYF